MSAVETFTQGDWSVRAVQVDGTPWFVATDVAKALGYSEAVKLTRRLDDDEKGLHSVETLGGHQEVSVISEPGLYAAVIGSKVANAKPFKRWVTHDVLPAVRKTGRYDLEARRPPQNYAEALRELAGEVERAERAEAQVEALEPAASAWNELAEDDGRDFSVREAAQALSRDPAITTGQNRLFATLRDQGWVGRRNTPYQNQIDLGRLGARVTTRITRDGDQVTDTQVRVTLKGLRDLHRLLGGTSPLRVTSQLRLIEGTVA